MVRAQSLFVIWILDPRHFRLEPPSCDSFFFYSRLLLARFLSPISFVMSASLTFEEMLQMPLNPSPVKDLSPQLPPVASAPASPSPQTSGALPLQRRKHPAEDMSQLAEDVSRDHKLTKNDHDALVGFSKVCALPILCILISSVQLGQVEQAISMMGSLLALGHRQRLLQPADTAWVVPKCLHVRALEKYSQSTYIILG